MCWSRPHPRWGPTATSNCGKRGAKSVKQSKLLRVGDQLHLLLHLAHALGAHQQPVWGADTRQVLGTGLPRKKLANINLTDILRGLNFKPFMATLFLSFWAILALSNIFGLLEVFLAIFSILIVLSFSAILIIFGIFDLILVFWAFWVIWGRFGSFGHFGGFFASFWAFRLFCAFQAGFKGPKWPKITKNEDELHLLAIVFVNPVFIENFFSIIVLIMMSSLRGKRSVPAEMPLGSSGNKLVTESVTRTTFTETTVSNYINVIIMGLYNL